MLCSSSVFYGEDYWTWVMSKVNSWFSTKVLSIYSYRMCQQYIFSFAHIYFRTPHIRIDICIMYVLYSYKSTLSFLSSTMLQSLIMMTYVHSSPWPQKNMVCRLWSPKPSLRSPGRYLHSRSLLSTQLSKSWVEDGRLGWGLLHLYSHGATQRQDRVCF